MLHEAAADGALYVDPDSPEQMAQAIDSILDDNDLRDRLIAAGKANVSRFSSKALAENMMALYRQLRDENN